MLINLTNDVVLFLDRVAIRFCVLPDTEDGVHPFPEVLISQEEVGVMKVFALDFGKKLFDGSTVHHPMGHIGVGHSAETANGSIVLLVVVVPVKDFFSIVVFQVCVSNGWVFLPIDIFHFLLTAATTTWSFGVHIVLTVDLFVVIIFLAE